MNVKASIYISDVRYYLMLGCLVRKALTRDGSFLTIILLLYYHSFLNFELAVHVCRDEEQETYEDVSITAGEGGGQLLAPSTSPSASSLVPPSPQHSIGSQSGVPPPSPTMSRNKK